MWLHNYISSLYLDPTLYGYGRYPAPYDMYSLAELLCTSWLIQAGLFKALQPADHTVGDAADVVLDHAPLERPRILDHQPRLAPVPVCRVQSEQNGHCLHDLRDLFAGVPVASNFSDSLVFGLLDAGHYFIIDSDGGILVLKTTNAKFLLFFDTLRVSRPWSGDLCSCSLLLYKALK